MYFDQGFTSQFRMSCPYHSVLDYSEDKNQVVFVILFSIALTFNGILVY